MAKPKWTFEAGPWTADEYDWALLKDGVIQTYFNGGHGFISQMADRLNAEGPWEPDEVQDNIDVLVGTDL